MKLKFAFFAEAAVVGDGLFSALRGGLDWVNARSFPAKMRHLVLLADVTFQPEEFDKEHKCVCQVTAPNGNVLAPDLTVLMKPFPNKAAPSKPNYFIGKYDYSPLTFPVAGEYVFRLSIGDNQLGEARIDVREAPE